MIWKGSFRTHSPFHSHPPILSIQKGVSFHPKETEEVHAALDFRKRHSCSINFSVSSSSFWECAAPPMEQTWAPTQLLNGRPEFLRLQVTSLLSVGAEVLSSAWMESWIFCPGWRTQMQESWVRRVAWPAAFGFRGVLWKHPKPCDFVIMICAMTSG